jgi:AraC family transcriptional regulator of adaptative response / DNA-3-methyladenine glycosylase II
MLPAMNTRLHMMPDPEVCERARHARDPRFDGRFFIAVKSTGIYCRPICPAPTAHARTVT